jgi:hypothetical protein
MIIIIQDECRVQTGHSPLLLQLNIGLLQQCTMSYFTNDIKNNFFKHLFCTLHYIFHCTYKFTIKHRNCKIEATFI